MHSMWASPRCNPAKSRKSKTTCYGTVFDSVSMLKRKVNLYIGMSRVVAPKAKVCKIYLAFAQTGILNVP